MWIVTLTLISLLYVYYIFSSKQIIYNYYYCYYWSIDHYYNYELFELMLLANSDQALCFLNICDILNLLTD